MSVQEAPRSSRRRLPDDLLEAERHQARLAVTEALSIAAGSLLDPEEEMERIAFAGIELAKWARKAQVHLNLGGMPETLGRVETAASDSDSAPSSVEIEMEISKRAVEVIYDFLAEIAPKEIEDCERRKLQVAALRELIAWALFRFDAAENRLPRMPVLAAARDMS